LAVQLFLIVSEAVMEHDRWLEQLNRLFDGDLVGTEKSETDQHLLSCAECLNTWRSWAQTREHLTPLRKVALGPGFRVRVMTTLDKNNASELEPRLTWVPWLGLAATAALTAALWLPTPGNEMAASDPTGLMSVASANTLPNNPMPDWFTEVAP
jgi:anti-sigma factor RsiW